MSEKKHSTVDRPFTDDPELARELEIMHRADALRDGLTLEELHDAIMWAAQCAGAKKMGPLGELHNALADVLGLDIPRMHGTGTAEEKVMATNMCGHCIATWRANAERRAGETKKDHGERLETEGFREGKRRNGEWLIRALARINRRFEGLPRARVLIAIESASEAHGALQEAAYALAVDLSGKAGLDWTRAALKKARDRIGD